ncbi:hypothetical protein IPG41_04650 [Candidatus Peregrinibacteria bacterium]|nr:MAG: hypothetical protein IPG41_04650 [Candidatus Peregrinibacteria bacterium]
MDHKLSDHIRTVNDRGHKSDLLKLCREVKEETGAEIQNARLLTNAELQGTLGRHCKNRIDLNKDRLFKSKDQLAEAAITAIHEAYHAKGRRKSGIRGKGIRHEGITELGAQKKATALGYRGFSCAYRKAVEGADQIANLITFDRMMELADQKEAPVRLQREITRALVEKHSMPFEKAAARAVAMEKAAA